MAVAILCFTAFLLLLILPTQAQIPALTTPPVALAPPTPALTTPPLAPAPPAPALSTPLMAIPPPTPALTTPPLALPPPTPAPTLAPKPINLTEILDEVGQYTTFIRLLTSTGVVTQVDNLLHTSIEGVTIFAPSDNAFNNLNSGTLNGLSVKGQVELIMYHVLPKFYTWTNLLLVSNPVTTLATGQDGLVFCLNFTSQGNQFNVSSGVVDAETSNALRKEFPLAIYQVDKVLLPEELFGNTFKAQSVSPLTPAINSTDGSENTTTVEVSQPSVDSEPEDDSASARINAGLGFVIGGLIFTRFLF